MKNANDSSSLSGKNRKEKNSKRGYMSIYHDIEEISYGPLCALPAIARVFLCIRHKLLRDGLNQKAIGHSFIMEATGLSKRQVISCAQKLQKAGIIIIVGDSVETKKGKLQHFENKYLLNPLIFGDDYNWYKNNPTVRAYSNDGTVGSYSKRGVAPSGVRVDTRGGVKSDTRVVSDIVPGTELKISDFLSNLFSNNPSSNKPKDKNPSYGDLNFSKKKPSATTLEEIEAEKARQLKAIQGG